jgi:hypothetical protein
MGAGGWAAGAGAGGAGRGAARWGGAGAAFLAPKSPPPEVLPPRRERCGEKEGQKKSRLAERCAKDHSRIKIIDRRATETATTRTFVNLQPFLIELKLV